MTEKISKSEIRKNHIIAFGALMIFAFYINRGIEIKGLYMDDLYLWSCFGDQSFFQYIFPLGSTRFRFVYYLASWIQLGIIGNHVEWFVPFNIFLNGCIAYSIYCFAKRLSRWEPISYLCGILYLLSRMSYYQISQVYGLMESMALWASIGILYCCYCYITEKGGNSRYLGWANLLYFLACFTHERYMVLLPLLLLTPVLRWNKMILKKKRILLWTVGTFMGVILIRMASIGTLSPAGTGGTDVKDTFQIKTAIKYALSQLAYVFGINAGPEHLNGMSWNQSPAWIHLLVILANIILAVVVVKFITEIKKEKDKKQEYISVAVLFVGFMMLCVVSSSVTIRVEMRWVYVTYTAALLFLAYMYGVITRHAEEGNMVKQLLPFGLICLFYGCLMFPSEQFYRGQFPNLYLWPNQLRYNSLAEETIGRYGTDIFGKKIYIIGNSYEMSDFTAHTFFKVYDKKRKAEKTEIIFIESIYDIGLIKDNMIVLREEPSRNSFQDITEFVQSMKCESVSGYYKDGWMDEQAQVRIITGEDGIIHLKLMYPGNITGNETIKIHVDYNHILVLPITQNTMLYEIQASPHKVVDLNFDCNFYMKDAQEQRGEKRLALLVTFETN